MLLIAVLECVAFNLPFWTTLAASTDTAAAENTLGPGLTRTDDGLLRVTDPTQAYLDVAADGTSRYARVDLVSPRDLPGEDKPLDTFHLRVDGDGSAGRTQSMSARSPRSLYLNTDAGATLRVWVQEAKGALVPILAVRANERVPFSWSWTRVAALACAVLLVLAWRPGSRLWRTRLDPSDRRQRWGLAAALAPAALLTCVNVVWQIVTAAPLRSISRAATPTISTSTRMWPTP